MKAPEHVLRNRPNKLARGMTATLYRSGHRLDDSALTLSVRGTTDILGSIMRLTRRKFGKCQCCGHPTAMRTRLSDEGRKHLARLRVYGKSGYYPRVRLP